MRAVLVVSLVALLLPAVALAQAPPAPEPPSAAPASPGAAPVNPGDVTRDQYIENAAARARRAAAKRFDQLDTNHDGILSAEERQAARAARAARAPGRPAPSQ